MSLTLLNQQIETLRSRATTLRANAQASLDAISRDASLSTIGKDNSYREVKDRSKASMDALQAEEDKLLTDKLTALERTVTGAAGSDSGSIINYRDAQDRADRITERSEATRLMTRALNSGDKTLASAVAQAALGHGWVDVYQSYATENPSNASAFEDLAAIKHSIDDIGSVIARAMAYSL
jgi:hypothetical protein